jgi:hypothetical protein
MALMAIALRMACACALTLGLVLGSGSGFAQEHDPDLPAVDPPGQGRAMTDEDATSTSQCVGNPITPLCAVETIIACFERVRDDLCRIGMGLDRPPEFVRGDPRPRPYRYQRYRVLSAKRFREHVLPPPHDLSPANTLPYWWYPEDRRQYWPGDVEIVVLKQTCWRDPARCDPVDSGDHYTYHLRRIGDRWAVLIWDTPDPRHEKVKPEKF